MLQQRKKLLDHLKVCIEESHRSHIPRARLPICYLECPLHSYEKECSPHIRFDQLTLAGEVTCPKTTECSVVPRKAYALLFAPSLNGSEH